MSNSSKIDVIFNILIQYEKIFQDDSDVTEESYKAYLDRLYVIYKGHDKEEISLAIKGLYNLGSNAEHSSVKRIVFHIIDILKKEEEYVL